MPIKVKIESLGFMINSDILAMIIDLCDDYIRIVICCSIKVTMFFVPYATNQNLLLPSLNNQLIFNRHDEWWQNTN